MYMYNVITENLNNVPVVAIIAEIVTEVMMVTEKVVLFKNLVIIP